MREQYFDLLVYKKARPILQLVHSIKLCISVLMAGSTRLSMSRAL